MNRRVVVGELAGLAWLCADAAWAIGDRLKIENTALMASCFMVAIVLGAAFVVMQAASGRGEE